MHSYLSRFGISHTYNFDSDAPLVAIEFVHLEFLTTTPRSVVQFTFYILIPNIYFLQATAALLTILDIYKKGFDYNTESCMRKTITTTNFG